MSTYEWASASNLFEPLTCNQIFGHPLLQKSCKAAWERIPEGVVNTLFMAQGSVMNAHHIELPQVYNDTDDNPSCKITISIDGHSRRNDYVETSWDDLRNTTRDIISFCVGGSTWGGWSTNGLISTFDRMIPLQAYDPVLLQSVQPSYVENPDGSMGVGMPPGWGGRNGFDVPNYLLITVTGPNIPIDERRTDGSIALTLEDYLRKKAMRSFEANDRKSYGAYERTRDAISDGFAASLSARDHPRWWEFTLGEILPEASHMQYHCQANLGSPSEANCESLLSELESSGEVSIDPAAPVIKTSGNCAVSFATKAKGTVSWALLRVVVEGLLAKCMTDPFRKRHVGGWASSKARQGRRSRKRGRTKRELPSAPQQILDSAFEVSLYQQEPFSTLPAETCAFHVAATHAGDVESCPAADLETHRARPPERGLRDGVTLVDPTTASPDSTGDDSSAVDGPPGSMNHDFNETLMIQHGTDVERLRDPKGTLKTVVRYQYREPEPPAPTPNSQDLAVWATNTAEWHEASVVSAKYYGAEEARESP